MLITILTEPCYRAPNTGNEQANEKSSRAEGGDWLTSTVINCNVWIYCLTLLL